MKKKNLLIGTLAVAGIGLAGWMGYKTFRKELGKAEKHLDKNEEEQTNEEEEVREVENNKRDNNSNYLEPSDFVADLALKVRSEFGSDDMFDVNQALAANARTIHVKRMSKSLDFLLEVPTSGMRIPSMGEFTTALKDATETTWKDYVKFVEQPFGQFEAWFIINYTDEEGKRHSGMARVPKDIRNLFRKKTEEGTIIKERPAFVESRCVRRLNEGYELQIPDTPKMKDAKLIKALLIWRISYYIGNKKWAGINLETATDCIDYFINKFSVESREAGEFLYDYVVFYSNDCWPELAAWTFKQGQKGYKMIESPLLYSEKKKG